MSCKLTIEQICTMTESPLFDRKSARIDAKTLAIHLIAFANADGGAIAIGVEDDGTITGIDAYQDHINELLRAPFDYCKPSVQIETEQLPCANKDGKPDHILLIEVLQSNELHSNQADDVFFRVGDKSKKLNFEERLQLMYAKGTRYFEDTPVPDATVDDIDLDFVRTYTQKLAVQLVNGIIVQSQRFLQTPLTIIVDIYDTLVAIQIMQELIGSLQSLRLLSLQRSGIGQEHTVLLPDILQCFREVVVILNSGTICVTEQLANVGYLESNILNHRIREDINIKVSLHSIEVFLVSGEYEGVVRLPIDVQCHAKHFIPTLVPPRHLPGQMAPVNFHIRCQQTADIRNKGTVSGIVVALRVYEKTACSVSIED